jgi:hypothetical protein
VSRTATKSMKSTTRAAEIARNIAFWQSRSQSEVIEDALVLYYEHERNSLAESVERAHEALTSGPAEALAYLTGETHEGLEELGMLAPERAVAG